MIPEQVCDQPEPTGFGHVFGKGTGSAAPLAWTTAQYVRLTQGFKVGNPAETAAVVAKRCATQTALAAPKLTVVSPADLATADGTVRVKGTTTGTAVYVSLNGQKRAIKVRNGCLQRHLAAHRNPQSDCRRRQRKERRHGAGDPHRR